MLHSILVHSHSGLRYIVLGLLIYAIFNAWSLRFNYTKQDKLINLFAMVFCHVQLLLGIILMFLSDKVNYGEGWIKNAQTRFYGMEHLLGMLAAITLITLGRRFAEGKELPADKHKVIKKYYLIGLILILISIPWPFREILGAGWF